MNKIHFEETDEPIDIRYDNVFKAVFTRNTPASNGALSTLISALIGRVVSVAGINANEPPIDSLRDRQIRFDINCRAENGELVNVEMSLNPDPFEPVRLEFHAGKLFTGQDIRGLKKSYGDLKEAYQITILARERFFPDEIFLHTFEYYDLVHGLPLKGKSRIVTLELSKLEKVVEKATEDMTVQEYWAVYFCYLTDKSRRQKINEIVRHERGIAMASEVLMTISKDEIERARLMSEYKYELDTQSRLVHAERKGLKEGMQIGEQIGEQKGIQIGKQEGIQIGKQEIIDLLKSGKSLEEIIRDYKD
jgi:predicted transposase/invertase (TIGR01784 family)